MNKTDHKGRVKKAKEALYLIHGHGHIKKCATALGINYMHLKHTLAGRTVSAPLLDKVEAYIKAHK